MLKLTYYSHSCFLLDDGKFKLIIDPFLTGNPTATIKAKDVKVNFIALTHAHGDHLGDAVEIAMNNDATIIAVNELANYVASQGAQAHNMHIGGSWKFPFGTLKFTIAHHGSSNSEGMYMGEPAGIIIKMGGKILYHTGDTGLFYDMKLIGEIDKIDIMTVCIGDNFTMGIDDAVRAVDFVKPFLAVPMHYNTFGVIEANPEEFKEKVLKKNLNCRIMKFGETIEI